MSTATGAETPTVVVRIGPSGFRTDIDAGGHHLTADEPIAVGGTGQGPTPYDFLAAALGACTAMTVRMYADRKGWPLDGVTARLRHGKLHEKDCENCATQTVGVDQMEVEVELLGDLTPEQRERLLSIAQRCPVKQTLANGVRVISSAAGAA
jgi:putative redox protein